MGRIPIYASKAPLRRTPMVRPQPDIAVSEAIGGLAETVGKIAMDWSTKKKDTEIQSEYVSNTIILKEAQATFLKAREDDPNPLDDDYIKSGYDEYMKTNLKDLVWKHNTSQKKFEQTRQISDLGTLQKAYDINRRKFISAEKVQGEIDTQKALNLRSKALIDLNISKLKPVYSTEVLKAKRIKDYHDLETLQIIDKLGIDIKADLSEFKALSTADKAKVIKLVQTERKRLKQVADDALGEEREQTEKAFTEKWVNNELTTAEVLASNLTGKRQQAYIKLIGADSAGSKAVNDIPIEAELLRRANTKEGTYQKFVDDVSEAVKEKTLTTAKAGTLLNKWFTKDKDAAYDKAEDVIYGGNITLDFPTRDKIWIDFNAIIDAEPDKYRGMAGYDLAVKMTDEAVEQNRSRFWEFFTASPISLLTNRLTKPQVRKPVAEKVKRDEEAKEEVTDYSKYWE